MPSCDIHECRLCHKTGVGLFKYAARHYAHARCGLERWNVKFLHMLPTHELLQFPALIAHEFNLLPTLEKMAK